MRWDDLFVEESLNPQSLERLKQFAREPARAYKTLRRMKAANGQEDMAIRSFGHYLTSIDGTHIEDVHYHAEDALELAKKVPRNSAYLRPGMHDCYISELLKLRASTLKFAKSLDLPPKRVEFDPRVGTLQGLMMSARSISKDDPEEALFRYDMALERAKNEGDDVGYFEAEAILAAAEANRADLAKLEQVAVGKIKPQTNDIGLQFGRAFWRLLSYQLDQDKINDAAALAKNALAYEKTRNRPNWVGLLAGSIEALTLLKKLETAGQGLVAFALEERLRPKLQIRGYVARKIKYTLRRN